VVSEIAADGGRAVADTSDILDVRRAGRVQSRPRSTRSVGIDIVVNNAGLAGPSSIEDVTEDTLARVMAVNFVGSVGTARGRLAASADAGVGTLVNTVSEVAPRR